MISKNDFIEKLKDAAIREQEIVQRYITHGSSFVFNGDEDKDFKLKKVIADNFSLNPECVIMIGSAKLGFSIAPLKLWKAFDDESDIDMVIISNEIFDEFWVDLYDFNLELTDRTEEEQERFEKFLIYFFKGWLRPDLFPFSYEKKNQWFDFFNSISYGEFGERKITGAIFRNFHFYENYHIQNVKKIRHGGI
jgi:predicted nucleotidyltransferase